MKVRRDAVTVGHLQTHRIVTVRGARIALEHCELSSWCYEGRRGAPWNGIRGECASFMRAGLCGHRKEPTRAAQPPNCGECDEKSSFHQFLPPWLILIGAHHLPGRGVFQ